MTPNGARAATTGAAIGLAWATSFRAWMTHLNIDFFNSWPHYTWQGTFVSVLLPPVVVGALIGLDWQRKWMGDEVPLIVWTPWLMVLGPALVAEDFIGTLLDTGMGGGAIAIVTIGMCGGYAISGRGSVWVRLLAGLCYLGATGVMVIGFYFWDRAVSASGSFGGVHLVVLLVSLSIGFSIPMRRRTVDDPRRMEPSQSRSFAVDDET